MRMSDEHFEAVKSILIDKLGPKGKQVITTYLESVRKSPVITATLILKDKTIQQGNPEAIAMAVICGLALGTFNDTEVELILKGKGNVNGKDQYRGQSLD